MKIQPLGLFLVTLIGVIALGASGCDAGNAPAGMSDGDAKAAINKMSPEQKIKAIASSPMSAPDKEKEYAKIEAETGVKAADVLKGDKPAGTGAGG